MKPPLARTVALAAVIVLASPARAAESRADVETDHIDAVDQGGPRTLRLAVQPFSPAVGLAQAEVDVALAEHVALSTALGWVVAPGGSGYRASVGLPVYPLRDAFHGIYLHPRVEWTHLSFASSVGGALSLGYAWTWPFGATTSFGAGLAYARGSAEQAGAVVAFGSFQPRIDGAVGWLF
jgi:hypothetical protein